MANTEKINFNISPNLKRDVERLANTYGKTLSAFMLDVCNKLVKANADRIQEQAQREKDPINFGEVRQPKTKKTATKKKLVDRKVGDDNAEG